jgi:ribosome recycling factor
MSFVLVSTVAARVSRRSLALHAAAVSRSLPLAPSGGAHAQALLDSSAAALSISRNMGAIRCKHAAKTGNHLENLNEMAHEKSHNEAQERRTKKKDKKATKKGKGGKKDDDTHTGAAAANVSDEQDHDDDDNGDMDDAHDDDDFNDEEDEELLPNPAKVKQRMQKVVERFEESLKAIRGSEPTPELFDDVMVDAYGSMAPLKSVAQVVIVSATQATATCFDPATAKAVSTAIRDALSLNPSIEEGGVVKIPLPRVSMETRQKTAAALGKKTESFRQRIRKVRRKALDVVKQGVAGKLDGVSKDDAFRVQKEVEALTDQVIQSLNDSAEKKHESIMSV